MNGDIRQQCFIHPFDEAARRKLEAIPGFSIAVKSFLKVGYERMLHGINMASKIRLSSTQLPDIYSLLPPICAKLGISEPELYLEMNPAPNAYTYGDSIISITLTSGLLEYMDKEELIAVIAHECGHIACRHVLYHTMASILLGGGSSLIQFLSIPMQLGLNFWVRRSELSADRAAVIVCGSQTPVINTMMRLAGGPKKITNNINIEEYASQADYYEKMMADSKWDSILQKYGVLYNTHPYAAVRVSEIIKWCKSDEYRAILEHNEILFSGLLCPACGNPVSNHWHFCKKCGNKLEK